MMMENYDENDDENMTKMRWKYDKNDDVFKCAFTCEYVDYVTTYVKMWCESMTKMRWKLMINVMKMMM